MISDYRKWLAAPACSLALLPIGALAAKQTPDDVTGDSAGADCFPERVRPTMDDKGLMKAMK